jgi:pimeloyl-ACP methyl ester carboxylesterase
MTMADNSIYEPIHQGKRRSFDIRRVRYNVTEWGDPDAPTFFYLHGWGDSGTTFQFVVDELQDDWHIVAPDWRGFGRSVVECSSYWFPDYLADLHALLDVYSPDEPARLVGHSMGANIGGLYAGTMPERVRAFVNVEGFGLNEPEPDAAPQRYRQWLAQSEDLPTFTTYADRRALAAKILSRNPQMSAAQADFVAGEWGTAQADGQFTLRADARHKLPNPVLYRRAEAEACWRAITADILLVSGGASRFALGAGQQDPSVWRDAETVEIAGAGHMLHFETPSELAAVIEAFFSKYL